MLAVDFAGPELSALVTRMPASPDAPNMNGEAGSPPYERDGHSYDAKLVVAGGDKQEYFSWEKNRSIRLRSRQWRLLKQAFQRQLLFVFRRPGILNGIVRLSV